MPINHPGAQTIPVHRVHGKIVRIRLGKALIKTKSKEDKNFNMVMLLGLDGENFAMDVNPNTTTLQDLKQCISKHVNVPVTDQRFIPDKQHLHLHTRFLTNTIEYQRMFPDSLDNQLVLTSLGITQQDSVLALCMFFIPQLQRSLLFISPYETEPLHVVQHERVKKCRNDDDIYIDAGLLAYGDDDEQADAVWEAVDARMRSRRRRRRINDDSNRMSNTNSDVDRDWLKNDLRSLTYEDWDQIPELLR